MNYKRRKKGIQYTNGQILPLNKDCTISASDPFIKKYGLIHVCSNTPFNEDGISINIPVAKGLHISDDPRQRGNIEVLIAEIISRYEREGGCSILINGDPGTGKTVVFIQTLASILGELCNTEVYLTMPTRSLVAQQGPTHGCDVRYGSIEIEEPGKDPNVRVYIYDHVNEIPSVTDKEITGVEHPIIFAIDEAHSLMTERPYRDDTLRNVVYKAREVLNKRGIVFALTASTDTIAPTIPYNGKAGYDVIIHFFGVSTDNSIIVPDGKLDYPNYCYNDVIKNGEDSGVRLTSSIPVDNLNILYRREKETIATAILSTISELTKDDDGKVIMVEHNNTSELMRIKDMLTEKGYSVAVFNGSDKGFDIDSQTKKITYHNKSFGAIIERSEIDADEATIILTTKVLESGTSISRIYKQNASEEEIKKLKEKTVCIYAVDRLEQFNMETIEQFLSRVRYDHNQAIIILPELEDRVTGDIVPNIEYYIQKEFYNIRELLIKIRNDEISRERLSYIDLIGKEDIEEGFAVHGYMCPETITKALMRAMKRYYKYLMYHRSIFELVMKQKYGIDKTVTFGLTPDPTVKISKKNPPLSSSQYKQLKNTMKEIVNNENMRDACIAGKYTYFDGEKERELPLAKMLNQCCRSNYKAPLKDTLAVAMTLQELQKRTNELLIVSEDRIILPENLLTDKQLISSMIEAVNNTQKNEINQLYSESVTLGFKYLSKFPHLFDIIKRYAIRYGDRGSQYMVKSLVEECVSALPRMDRNQRNLIKNLMFHLFNSDVKKPIDRMIYSCGDLRAMDMTFYVNMAMHSKGEIEDITFAHQVTAFVLNPSSIHSKYTASGATFEAMTSAAAYKAVTGEDITSGKAYIAAFHSVTGEDYDTGKNKPWTTEELTKIRLKAWVGRSISRRTAKIIHEEYLQIFEQKHPDKAPLRSQNSGVLKVLRLFAAAFVIDKRYICDGKEYSYLLRSVRVYVPDNYDEIIKLTFKA